MYCAVCNKEMDALNWNAWKCEYCNKIFCGNHISTENHNCEKVPKEEFVVGEDKEKDIEHKNRPKRPIAVNLIILWLILAPILNVVALIYVASHPIQPQIINQTQILDPNYYYPAGLDVKSASTTSVKLSAENYVNIYLLDKAELEKLKNGENFHYYPEGSRLNVSFSEFQVDLQAGEWYFVLVNPHKSESVKVNIEINYVKSADSTTYKTTSSPSYTPNVGWIGLIFYLSAINSLWKMKKNWLWYVYLVLGAGIVFNVLSFYWWGFNWLNWIDWLVITQSGINITCIHWLYKNRNLFIESKPPTKTIAEKQKEKGEWKKVGLIVLGMFGIPILIILINPNYILYAFFSIPIWAIFVWFLLPRIYRKTKSQNKF